MSATVAPLHAFAMVYALRASVMGSAALRPPAMTFFLNSFTSVTTSASPSFLVMHL
jgi:hypothetical protein